MNKKQILVTKSSMPSLEEYINEIRTIWDSCCLTNMGPKHEEFRNKLREYMDISDIELLTNGHMALELTLQAFGFPPGSEVITTPFTFASTTHAIIRNGLVPVFCDIKDYNYTINEKQIETLITEKTVAILPVHVYGNICNVEEIERIARNYKLKVIYDAAHTFGIKYNGKSIAEFGDASCFSFHATKVFNSIEGGAVVFKDKEFGKRLYQLKNFGIQSEEVVDGVGANAKMNEFCAAMGICNLRHIDDEIAKRGKLVEHYRHRILEKKGIKLNFIQENIASNHAYFPVVFDETILGITRDQVCAALKDQGIVARKYFYPLTSAYECYRGQFNLEDTPVALKISKSVLTLPLYADLDIEIVDRICDIIIDVLGIE